MVPAVAGRLTVTATDAPAPAVALGGRTLVLNVTYQPISIVSARRAVLLVLAGKAEVTHSGVHVVRSEAVSVPVPSVVRLAYFVKVPFRRRAPLHRRAIFARDGHRCQYCSAPAECIDHVHPRSRGGEHTWENVVACCRPCNSRKGDSLLSDTALRLRRPPFAPEAMAVAAAARGGIPGEWEDYLPSIVPLSA